MSKETLERIGINLEAAIFENDTAYIKLLISEKRDLNIEYGNRYTALIMAVSQKRKKIVKLLLDHGVNLDLKDKKTGETALMVAVQMGSVELFKLLIEKGANVNLREKSRDWTPLMFSILNMRDALRGNRPRYRFLEDATEITKLLLNAQDIDIYFKDCEGNSAYSLAQPFPRIVEIMNNRFPDCSSLL